MSSQKQKVKLYMFHSQTSGFNKNIFAHIVNEQVQVHQTQSNQNLYQRVLNEDTWEAIKSSKKELKYQYKITGLKVSYDSEFISRNFDNPYFDQEIIDIFDAPQILKGTGDYNKGDPLRNDMKSMSCFIQSDTSIQTLLNMQKFATINHQEQYLNEEFTDCANDRILTILKSEDYIAVDLILKYFETFKSDKVLIIELINYYERFKDKIIECQLNGIKDLFKKEKLDDIIDILFDTSILSSQEAQKLIQRSELKLKTDPKGYIIKLKSYKGKVYRKLFQEYIVYLLKLQSEIKEYFDLAYDYLTIEQRRQFLTNIIKADSIEELIYLQNRQNFYLGCFQIEEEQYRESMVELFNKLDLKNLDLENQQKLINICMEQQIDFVDYIELFTSFFTKLDKNNYDKFLHQLQTKNPFVQLDKVFLKLFESTQNDIPDLYLKKDQYSKNISLIVEKQKLFLKDREGKYSQNSQELQKLKKELEKKEKLLKDKNEEIEQIDFATMEDVSKIEKMENKLSLQDRFIKSRKAKCFSEESFAQIQVRFQKIINKVIKQNPLLNLLNLITNDKIDQKYEEQFKQQIYLKIDKFSIEEVRERDTDFLDFYKKLSPHLKKVLKVQSIFDKLNCEAEDKLNKLIAQQKYSLFNSGFINSFIKICYKDTRFYQNFLTQLQSTQEDLTNLDISEKSFNQFKATSFYQNIFQYCHNNNNICQIIKQVEDEISNLNEQLNKLKNFFREFQTYFPEILCQIQEQQKKSSKIKEIKQFYSSFIIFETFLNQYFQFSKSQIFIYIKSELFQSCSSSDLSKSKSDANWQGYNTFKEHFSNIIENLKSLFEILSNKQELKSEVIVSFNSNLNEFLDGYKKMYKNQQYLNMIDSKIRKPTNNQASIKKIDLFQDTISIQDLKNCCTNRNSEYSDSDFGSIINEIKLLIDLLQFEPLSQKEIEEKLTNCQVILFFVEIREVFQGVNECLEKEKQREDDKKLDKFLTDINTFSSNTPLYQFYHIKIEQQIKDLFENKDNSFQKNLKKFLDSKILIQKTEENQDKGLSFYDMREFISDSQHDLSCYLALLHEYTPFFLKLSNTLKRANEQKQSTYETMVLLNKCILNNTKYFDYWDDVIKDKHKLGQIEGNLEVKKTFLNLLKNMYLDGITIIQISHVDQVATLMIKCNGEEYHEQKIREISSRVLIEKHSINNIFKTTQLGKQNINEEQRKQQLQQENMERFQTQLELAYEITTILSTLREFGFFLFEKQKYVYSNQNEQYEEALSQMREDYQNFKKQLSLWRHKSEQTFQNYPKFTLIGYPFYPELDSYFKGQKDIKSLSDSLTSLIKYQINSSDYQIRHQQFSQIYHSTEPTERLNLIGEQFNSRQYFSLFILFLQLARFLTGEQAEIQEPINQHNQQMQSSLIHLCYQLNLEAFLIIFIQIHRIKNKIWLIKYESISTAIRFLLKQEIQRKQFLSQCYLFCDQFTKIYDIDLFIKRYQYYTNNTKEMCFYLIINTTLEINYNEVLLELVTKNQSYQNYFYVMVNKQIYKEELRFIQQLHIQDICQEKFNLQSLNWDLYLRAQFFSSKSPGEGKTESVRKASQKTNASFIRFSINGEASKCSLIDSIMDVTVKESNSKEKKKCYHVDLYEVEEFDLNLLLFEMIVLKSFTSNQNKYIHFGNNPLFLIEINNTVKNSLEEKLKIKDYFERKLVSYNLDQLDLSILSQRLKDESLLCYKYLYGIDQQNKKESSRKNGIFSGLSRENQYFDEKKNIEILANKESIDSDQFIELLRNYYEQYIIDKQITPNFWQIINFIKIFGTEMNKFEQCTQVFLSQDHMKDKIRGLRTTIISKSFELCKKVSMSCLKKSSRIQDNASIEEFLTQKMEDLTYFGDLQTDFVTFQEQQNPSISTFFQTTIGIPKCIQALYESQNIKKHFAFDNQYTNDDYMNWLIMLCNQDSQNFYKFEKNKTTLQIKEENSSRDIQKMIIEKDNFFKIAMIFLRIRANTPVILMGEAGIGKTALIQLLSHIMDAKFISQIIHAGITQNDIIDIIQRAENEANHKKVIVFFDEVNTNSLVSGLFKEIIVDRHLKGKKINENIIPIAALNPYKLKSPEQQKIIQAQIYGGIKKDLVQKFKGSDLEYIVFPIPESMYNFTWNYGGLSSHDEKLYINSLLIQANQKLEGVYKFNIDFINTKLTDLVFESQQYLRQQMGNRVSACSLRDVKRFTLLLLNILQFLKDTSLCNDKLQGVQMDLKQSELHYYSAYLSAYINYYIRIPFAEKRAGYLKKLENLKINNNYDQKFIEDDIIKKVEDFFISRIEIPEGIAKNKTIKQNIFMQFICIINKIPVCIVGPPGSSKTLSTRLLIQAMQGKNSKDILFQQYPALMPTYYQGHLHSTSERIYEVFENARRKQKELNQQKHNDISLVFIDEIGLAEISHFNPLKVLHHTLENQDLAFACISNWPLDASKMNRMLTLYRMEMALPEIKDTFESIFKEKLDSFKEKQINCGIIKKLNESLDDNRQNQISKIYHNYLSELKQNHTDLERFHGLRDFYAVVKQICDSLINSSQESIFQIDTSTLQQLIQRAYFRNLSGLQDSHFLLQKQFKTTFKQSDFVQLQYNALEYMNDNLSGGINSRHLMIITGNTEIVAQYLKVQLKNQDYRFFIGIDFEEDNKLSECYNIINKIINCIEEGKTIILQNLDAVYQSLYELLNQKYRYYNGKYYCRITLGAESSIIQVSQTFKLILLIHQNQLHRLDGPLINRFEKHYFDSGLILNSLQQEQLKKLIKQFEPIKDHNKTISYFKFTNIDQIIKSYFIQYICQKKSQINNNQQIVEYQELIDEEDLLIITFRLFHLSDFTNVVLNFNADSYGNFQDLKSEYINSGYHYSLDSFIEKRITLQENKYLKSNHNLTIQQESKLLLNQMVIFTMSPIVSINQNEQNKVIVLKSIQSESQLVKELEEQVNEQCQQIKLLHQQQFNNYRFENNEDHFMINLQVKTNYNIVICADMSHSGTDSRKGVEFCLQKIDERIQFIYKNVKEQLNISQVKSEHSVIMIIKVDHEFEMIPISGKWEFYMIEELYPFSQYYEEKRDSKNQELIFYIKDILSLESLIKCMKKDINEFVDFEKLIRYYFLSDQQLCMQAYEGIKYIMDGQQQDEQDYKFKRLKQLNQIFYNNHPSMNELISLLKIISLITMEQSHIHLVEDLINKSINSNSTTTLHYSVMEQLRSIFINSTQVLIYFMENKNMVYSMIMCSDLGYQKFIIRELGSQIDKFRQQSHFQFQDLRTAQNYITINTKSIYNKLFSIKPTIQNYRECLSCKEDELYKKIFQIADEILKEYQTEINLFSDLIILDIQTNDIFKLDQKSYEIICYILFLYGSELEGRKINTIYLEDYRGKTNSLIHIYLIWLIFEDKIKSITEMLKFYEQYMSFNEIFQIFQQNYCNRAKSPFDSLQQLIQVIATEFHKQFSLFSPKMKDQKMLNEHYPTFMTGFMKFLYQNTNSSNSKKYNEISFYNKLVELFSDILYDQSILEKVDMDILLSLDLNELKNIKNLFQSRYLTLNQIQNQIHETKYNIKMEFLRKWIQFLQQIIVSSVKNEKLFCINADFLSVLIWLENDERELQNNRTSEEFQIYLCRVFKKLKYTMNVDNIKNLFYNTADFLYRENQYQECYTLLIFGQSLQNLLFSDYLMRLNENNENITTLFLEQDFDKLDVVQKTIFISFFRQLVVKIVNSHSEEYNNLENEIVVTESLKVLLQNYFANLENEALRLFIVKQLIYSRQRISDFCEQSFIFKKCEWLKIYSNYVPKELEQLKNSYLRISSIKEVQYEDDKFNKFNLIRTFVLENIVLSTNLFQSLLEGIIDTTRAYPFCMESQLQSEIDLYNTILSDKSKQLYECLQCKHPFIYDTNTAQNIIQCTYCYQDFKLNEPNKVKLILKDLYDKKELQNKVKSIQGICIKLDGSKNNRASIKNCNYQWIGLFSMVYHTILSLSIHDESNQNNLLNQIETVEIHPIKKEGIEMGQIKDERVTKLKKLLSIPLKMDNQQYLQQQVINGFNQFYQYFTSVLLFSNEKSIYAIHEFIKFILIEDQIEHTTEANKQQNNQFIQNLLEIKLQEFKELNNKTTSKILEYHNFNYDTGAQELLMCYPKSLKYNAKNFCGESVNQQIQNKLNQIQDFPLLNAYNDMEFIKLISQTLRTFLSFYQSSLMQLSYQFQLQEVFKLTLQEAAELKTDLKPLYNFYNTNFLPDWNNCLEKIVLKNDFRGFKVSVKPLDNQTKLIDLIYSYENGPTQFYIFLTTLSKIQNEMIGKLLDYCENNSSKYARQLYQEIWIWFKYQDSLDQYKFRKNSLQNINEAQIINYPSQDIFEQFVTNGFDERDGIEKKIIFDLNQLQHKLVREIFYNTQLIDLEKSTQLHFMNEVHQIQHLQIKQQPKELLPENQQQKLESILQGQSNEQVKKFLLQMSTLYSFIGTSFDYMEISVISIMQTLGLKCVIQALEQFLEEVQTFHLYSIIIFLEEKNMDHLVSQCSNKYKGDSNYEIIEGTVRKLNTHQNKHEIKLIVGRIIIRELLNENSQLSPDANLYKSIEDSLKITEQDKNLILQILDFKYLKVCNCHSLFQKIQKQIRDSNDLSTLQSQISEQDHSSNNLLLESFSDKYSQNNISQLYKK